MQNILNRLLDENILGKFSNTPLQHDMIGGLQRQTCNNLENLHVGFKSSPSKYQDYNIPMLSRNASANKSEKENTTRIDVNKKNKRSINWDDRDDTAIQGNISNKETNESISNNNTDRIKTEAWPKRACLVTGDSMLGHIDETRMSRKFNAKIRPFPGAKT